MAADMTRNSSLGPRSGASPLLRDLLRIENAKSFLAPGKCHDAGENWGSSAVAVEDCETDSSSDSDSDSDELNDSCEPTSKSTSLSGFPNAWTSSRRRLLTEAEVEREEIDEAAVYKTLDDLEERKAQSLVLASWEITSDIARRVRASVWLTELDLHCNGLTQLPIEVCEMPNLEILRVTENGLTTLPAQISGLVSLKTLDLNHNGLVNLPLELSSLKQLRTCILDHNNLSEVPLSALQIPTLQSLCIAENPEIRNAPDVSLVRIYLDLSLHINNAPSLVEDLNAISAEVAGLHVTWNKVYPDRILDWLYMGSLRTAQDPQVYSELGIQNVLTCGRNLAVVIAPGMKHLTLVVSDMLGESIAHSFDEGVAFLQEASDADQKALVHCFAGISRSASLVCAYLIKTFRWPLNRALAFVRERRPAAQPNESFLQQLMEYQKQLGIPDEG